MVKKEKSGFSEEILDKITNSLFMVELDYEDRAKRILIVLVVIIANPILFLYAILNHLNDRLLTILLCSAMVMALTLSFIASRKIKNLMLCVRINVILLRIGDEIN